MTVVTTVEPLDDQLDRSRFHCGVDELDTWFASHAVTARGQGVRTHVAFDPAGRIVGYFAIAPHIVEREGLPASIARGAPARIPAVLFAKLARGLEFRGEGVGSELLVRALEIIVPAAKIVGGRLVVVDALDESAARFYLEHDFVRIPAREDRLVMKLSTAAKALGIGWP